jgi:hypothetical protein
MGHMPPSRGRYIAVGLFVFVLTFSPYAHAADTTAFGINDPFADAIQLWSAVFSSLDTFAHQIASALQLHQTLTFTAKPHAPKNLQQPATLAASAALATESPPETATTSGSASDASSTPQQPQTTGPPGALSDQTTHSPFVKSAVSAPLASNRTTQSSFVKAAISGPLAKSSDFSPSQGNSRQYHQPPQPTSSPNPSSVPRSRSSAPQFSNCSHRAIRILSPNLSLETATTSIRMQQSTTSATSQTSPSPTHRSLASVQVIFLISRVAISPSAAAHSPERSPIPAPPVHHSRVRSASGPRPLPTCSPSMARSILPT